MPSSLKPSASYLAEGPVVLSICLDVDRARNREQALSSAGFRVISASTIEAAVAVSHHCEFSIVVLDHECCSQLNSLSLKPPYVILGRAPAADENKLVQDLLALCSRRTRVRKLTGTCVA